MLKEWGIWESYLDRSVAQMEARNLKKVGWQTRVTTRQGRWIVWVKAKNNPDPIFIRGLAPSENWESTYSILQKIPNKPGYAKAYKPYGWYGRGFYYVKTDSNPYPQVCPHCGAKIYGVITPVSCPVCKKPWVKGNPTAMDRLIRQEDDDEIQQWLARIRNARDFVERRNVIATMIRQAKTDPDMIEVVRQVIKRGRLHAEVDALRLRGLLNPVRPKSNPDDLYESFHGVPVSRKVKVYYEPPPGELIQIGDLTQINYSPRHPSKRSGEEYYHKSGDTGEKMRPTNLVLATDKDGKNLYLVKKNKNNKHPIFTERGIIG